MEKNDKKKIFAGIVLGTNCTSRRTQFTHSVVAVKGVDRKAALSELKKYKEESYEDFNGDFEYGLAEIPDEWILQRAKELTRQEEKTEVLLAKDRIKNELN